MGRSGGGGFSGGGRSSGGFRSGTRTSGGFSGGSRSGGRSRAPYSGGGSYRPRSYGFGFPSIFAPRISVGGSQPSTPYSTSSPQNVSQTPGASPQSGNSGCGTVFIVVAVLALVLFLGAMLFGGGCSSDSVASSTHERQALPAGTAEVTPLYADQDGDWIHNASALEDGLRHFYDETGIMPYLYILPNGSVTSIEELSGIATQVYDQLFTDEAHFVLVFCDQNDGSFLASYAIGQQADTIMDSEAIGILSQYLEANYNNYSISEEEIFSRTFASTADRIMEVTPSPAIPIAICLAVIVVVAVVAYLIIKKRNDQRREAERMEQILNTPLESFEDDAVEDLAEKYEQSDPDPVKKYDKVW